MEEKNNLKNHREESLLKSKRIYGNKYILKDTKVTGNKYSVNNKTKSNQQSSINQNSTWQKID